MSFLMFNTHNWVQSSNGILQFVISIILPFIIMIEVDDKITTNDYLDNQDETDRNNLDCRAALTSVAAKKIQKLACVVLRRKRLSPVLRRNPSWSVPTRM